MVTEVTSWTYKDAAWVDGLVAQGGGGSSTPIAMINLNADGTSITVPDDMKTGGIIIAVPSGGITPASGTVVKNVAPFSILQSLDGSNWTDTSTFMGKNGRGIASISVTQDPAEPKAGQDVTVTITPVYDDGTTGKGASFTIAPGAEGPGIASISISQTPIIDGQPTTVTVDWEEGKTSAFNIAPGLPADDELTVP